MEKKICYVVTIGRTINAFFMDQLSFLAKKGMDITVICRDDCDLGRMLPKEVKLIDINIPRGISLWRSVKALSALRNVFRKNDFDLIQYSTPNAGFLASIAARAEKTPVRNYHLMGLRYESENGFRYKILKWFEKTTCQNSTHIECVCESTRQKGIREGLFSEEKSVVVGHGSTGGINTEKFSISHKKIWRDQVRNQYGISDDEMVYGFVGRIATDKGIREIYKAWRTLLSENSKRVLLMIGPVEDELLSAQLRSLDHVIFTGNVSDPERFYAAMDTLILPSYREGFGTVLIEAEMLGVPCIASNIEGPRDAIQDGKTGILIPPHDAEALAKAMIIMSNTEKRKCFSENASQFAKFFDSNVLCESIYERKKQLLGLDE